MLSKNILSVVGRYVGAVVPFLTTGLLLMAASSPALGARVDFSGVNLASVEAAAGQDFNYTVGTGPGTGTVNVRLLSPTDAIVDLTTGDTPDPTGFDVKEHSDNLATVTFRFTFDAPRMFQIDENETLTKAEINEFALPSGAWNLLSMVNATNNTAGSTISFTGTNYFAPYGHYSISGAGSSFDFTVTNFPAFSGIYGSAISIDVVPEPATLSLLALGGLVAMKRRRS